MGVDFIKVVVRHCLHLLDNETLDFRTSLNLKTGETNNFQIAKYENMEFVLYDSGLLILKGSLHKYFNSLNNDGLHNFNDFNFINLLTVLNDLEHRFDLDFSKARIQNIEFGVNLLLDYLPMLILSNCLFFGIANFESGKNGYYRQAVLSDFFFKLYDKGKQYRDKKFKVKGNVMRYELKFIRMRQIVNTGLVYLSDLRKLEWQPIVRQRLLDEFDRFYFFDYTTNHEVDDCIVLNWKSVIYWNSLKGKKRQREKEKFRLFTIQHSNNLLDNLKTKIASKWDELYNPMAMS